MIIPMPKAKPKAVRQNLCHWCGGHMRVVGQSLVKKAIGGKLRGYIPATKWRCDDCGRATNTFSSISGI